MARYLIQILARVVNQRTRVVQFDGVGEPLVPAPFQRVRPGFQLRLARLRRLHAVQRPFRRLRRHGYDIVKTVARIRDRLCRLGDRLIEPQFAHAVAQHSGQLADAGDDLSAVAASLAGIGMSLIALSLHAQFFKNLVELFFQRRRRKGFTT